MKPFLMARKIYHRNDIRPALIEMSLPARRLTYLWLASLDREKDLTTGKTTLRFDPKKIFELRVETYAELCGIDYSAAYRQIIEGVKDLRGFVLTPDHTLTKKIDPSLPKDWVEPFTIADRGTGYSKGEGFVKIQFAPELQPLISDLSTGFTGQLLSSAIHISQSNASKLYLVLREWLSSNSYVYEKSILFDDFKELLGVSNTKTHDNFKNLNTKFIKPSIATLIEKTEFSAIQVEIEERRARKAYRLKISWELKPDTEVKKSKELQKIESSQRDPDTADLFHKMTDKQIDYFAAKLAQDSAFGSQYAKTGESIKDFEQRLKCELKDVNNQQRMANDLKRVGYK